MYEVKLRTSEPHAQKEGNRPCPTCITGEMLYQKGKQERKKRKAIIPGFSWKKATNKEEMTTNKVKDTVIPAALYDERIKGRESVCGSTRIYSPLTSLPSHKIELAD